MQSGVNQYPFWRPDKRQDPARLVSPGLRQLIGDMPNNQTPLHESRQTNIQVIFTPRVRQDSLNVPQGDKMQSGVGRPGGLYDRLMAGIPTTDKGTK